MEKYLAINLGPISTTFSMARKPREFWAASYLFSCLMECILDSLSKDKRVTLISPYYEEGCNNVNVRQSRMKVGLFPDRSFYKVNEVIDLNGFLDEPISCFAFKVNLKYQTVKRYFNVMVACHDYESDADAVVGLNALLDRMELNKYTCDVGDYEHIYRYLQRTSGEGEGWCSLYQLVYGEWFFPMDSLEKLAKLKSDKILWSRQKYVCIVQADGDGMGTVVKSDKLNGKLSDFSKKLMEFAKKASEKIGVYGGWPIYAGGDDLLFIAPIYGNPINKDKDSSIFDLIDCLDGLYNESVMKFLANEVPVRTSMSYGISMIYHKYPLYEAWKVAASMLFEKAKKVDGKNAIAISLRKHSGSELEVKMNKASDFYCKFKEIIENTPDESLVSAVAHKVRTNEPLLGCLMKDDWNLKDGETVFRDRLGLFFDKMIDAETKNEQEKKYVKLTEELYALAYSFVKEEKRKEEERQKEKSNEPHKTVNADDGNEISEEEKIRTKEGEWNVVVNDVVQLFYSVLRIAKFVKGEELKDE